MNKCFPRNKALVCLLMMTVSNYFHGIVDYHHIIPFLRKPSVSKQKIPGGTGCTRLTLSSTDTALLTLLCSSDHFRCRGPGQDQRAKEGSLQAQQQGPEQGRQPPALRHREQHRLLQGACGQGEDNDKRKRHCNFHRTIVHLCYS